MHCNLKGLLNAKGANILQQTRIYLIAALRLRFVYN